MGSLQLCTPVGSVLKPRKTINMNKFLAVLCLAAGAMADADADPYYAAYGYAAGLPYAGLAGYAGLGYAGYGYAGYPALVAGGYASYSPSASTHIAGLAAPAAPAVAGGYVTNSAGVVHVAKRSAEADPYYAAYGYGLGAYGLGYAGAGLGYAGAYGAYPYGVGYASGYASHSPSAAVNIAGLAPAAAPALGGGYAAAGRYCANSAGVIHCA